MAKLPAARISIEDVSARVLRSGWFIGLVSVTVLGLLALASWPWWLNRFILTTNTRYVEISASAPGLHEIGVKLPQESELRIFGAQADDLPPELHVLAAATVSVQLVASGAVLQTISLPNEAQLVVHTTSEGGVDIGVLNGGSISLALSGTIERVDEKGKRTTIAKIERATEWNIRPADKYGLARLVLSSGIPPVALYSQPINELRFRPPRPTDDDPRTFQSEVLSGKVKLLDTDTTTELQPRELILLEGGSRFLSRLEVIDKTIAVDVSGDAERISIGAPRAGRPFRLDRDLTPSMLVYLVAQHQLKILWSVAVAALAALWKARQWALKWEK